MRNAEEWIQDYFMHHTVQDESDKDACRTVPPRECWIRAIQSDALREAANVAEACIDENFHPNYHAAAQIVKSALLTSAQALEKGERT